jgi:hypothetical protein
MLAMRSFRRAAVVLLVLTLCSGLLAGPAAADDPPFIPWSQLLPGLSSQYDPSSANYCTAGKIRCIDAVIKEMDRRLDRSAAKCDHDAIFDLTYLRTTEQFRRASTTSGFFEDPPFLNHWAGVFATYYFDAYDDWQAGRKSSVPVAWKVAFEAADKRQVSAGGNLLLGMSAHVNRDLPFVLAEIGLVKPDGSSRKRDHDKVNEFLNRVTEPLIAEVARRFDPSISGLDVQGTQLDATTLFQAIVVWRETAWRNAELLVAAKSAAARATVAAEIETQAATIQSTLKTANAYVPLVTSGAGRDAFCSTHWQG